MGTVSRTAYSSGATITAALQNSNENAIVNEINGNLDNDNIKSGANIAASKINLATIAQTMALSGVAMNWAKGSDVASATTCDIGAATGNYIDVTGTTTITGLGTVQAGTIRWVRFTGALTLTHNGTSLMLPTAANITTVAGDVACFVSLGSGNWKCLHYQRYDGTALVGATAANALTGSVIQTVNTNSGAVATGTTAIPFDDSDPNPSTEGNNLAALDTAITPNHADNLLIITGVIHLAHSSDTAGVAAILWKNSDTSSLNVFQARQNGSTYPVSIPIYHKMTAGGTSAITFKINYGGDTGSTVTVNGYGGSRKYGGKMISHLTVQEIKA